MLCFEIKLIQQYVFLWINFYCYCCDVLILVHLPSDVREIELVKTELLTEPILWTYYGHILALSPN